MHALYRRGFQIYIDAFDGGRRVDLAEMQARMAIFHLQCVKNPSQSPLVHFQFEKQSYLAMRLAPPEPHTPLILPFCVSIFY